MLGISFKKTKSHFLKLITLRHVSQEHVPCIPAVYTLAIFKKHTKDEVSKKNNKFLKIA